jgi:hypothetical protein
MISYNNKLYMMMRSMAMRCIRGRGDPSMWDPLYLTHRQNDPLPEQSACGFFISKSSQIRKDIR